ncbi:MAG TPA: hypothetical protein VK846_16235 [Candidatus Limnocylindria bacterium]|nr:hypothetical protein [Candidatus Limnocylindria bacterium]
MTAATEQSYVSKIMEMQTRAREWCARNSERDVRVQFNFGAGVMVCATIKDALKNHFVTANDAGLELIKAVEGPDNGLSVLMLRAALEMWGAK